MDTNRRQLCSVSPRLQRFQQLAQRIVIGSQRRAKVAERQRYQALPCQPALDAHQRQPRDDPPLVIEERSEHRLVTIAFGQHVQPGWMVEHRRRWMPRDQVDPPGIGHLQALESRHVSIPPTKSTTKSSASVDTDGGAGARLRTSIRFTSAGSARRTNRPWDSR